MFHYMQAYCKCECDYSSVTPAYGTCVYLWILNAACVVTPLHFVPFFARIAQVYDENPGTPDDVHGLRNIKPEKTSVDVVITDPVAQLACCTVTCNVICFVGAAKKTHI